MECGRGPSAFFSRTAKPACFAVPARSRVVGPRARPVCDGEALSPDGLLLVPRNGRRPLPQTAGEGCLRLLLLSWFFEATPSVSEARGTRRSHHPMRDLAKRPLLRRRGNAPPVRELLIHPGSAVREAPRYTMLLASHPGAD